MSRCFASTRSMATTAGERTNVKRQSAIYRTTAANAGSNEYNSYDRAYNVNDGCLKSAASYGGFLDMVKGKHLINPQLDGAPAAKSEAWAGNFVAIDLSGATHPSVVSIVASGTSIAYGVSNEVVFPAIDYSPGAGFGGGPQYPGWVLDPSAAALIDCLSSTSVPVYFERFGRVSYRSSQAYWDAVTQGDLLNGMQFPSRVNFAFQPTDLSSATALAYAPMSSFDTLDPTAQLARWCSPGDVPRQTVLGYYIVALWRSAYETVGSQWPTAFGLDISSYSAAYGPSDPYYTDLFNLYNLMASLTPTLESLKTIYGVGAGEVRILVGEYNLSDTLVSGNGNKVPSQDSGIAAPANGYADGYDPSPQPGFQPKIYGYLSYYPGNPNTDANGFLYPAGSQQSTLPAGTVATPTDGSVVPLFFTTGDDNASNLLKYTRAW